MAKNAAGNVVGAGRSGCGFLFAAWTAFPVIGTLVIAGVGLAGYSALGGEFPSIEAANTPVPASAEPAPINNNQPQVNVSPQSPQQNQSCNKKTVDLSNPVGGFFGDLGALVTEGFGSNCESNNQSTNSVPPENTSNFNSNQNIAPDVQSSGQSRCPITLYGQTGCINVDEASVATQIIHFTFTDTFGNVHECYALGGANEYNQSVLPYIIGPGEEAPYGGPMPSSCTNQ